MDFDADKFERLVHYVCQKAHNPEILGATKLNKILWLADMYAYMHWGNPITGERYIKRQYGPVPEHILSALDALKAKGAIVWRDADYYGRQKREYVALCPSDVTEFSAEEISLVDEVFNYICHNHTARSISDMSHNVIWKIANIGEAIPYETVFAVHQGEIDEVDIAWAKDLLGDAA